jgi:hypothetical protein
MPCISCGRSERLGNLRCDGLDVSGRSVQAVEGEGGNGRLGRLPILPLHHEGIPQSGLSTLLYIIEKEQESRVLRKSVPVS